MTLYSRYNFHTVVSIVHFWCLHSFCSIMLIVELSFERIVLFRFPVFRGSQRETTHVRKNRHGTHHRLNGCSSPVLTATCLSYGSLCDFLGFFPNRPEGHTPRPILTQNGSNDVDSRKDVPFGVKIATF